MNLLETIETAVKSARVAYQFNPGSYTWEALTSCLRMEAAVERVLGPLRKREAAE